jgi:hypothetical protein
MTASSCCSPHLRRDLALEQGQVSFPVASFSSPSVDLRTSCPRLLRIVLTTWSDAIACEGRANYPRLGRCSVTNAAADVPGSQVRALGGTCGSKGRAI